MHQSLLCSLKKEFWMASKKKRQVSKGTGKRYTSDKPKPQATPPVRTVPLPTQALQANTSGY
jgi:hypothetical protein